MAQTIKIRFTEPQIALVMRAHPNCNLDRLTEGGSFFRTARKSEQSIVASPVIAGDAA